MIAINNHIAETGLRTVNVRLFKKSRLHKNATPPISNCATHTCANTNFKRLILIALFIFFIHDFKFTCLFSTLISHINLLFIVIYLFFIKFTFPAYGGRLIKLLLPLRAFSKTIIINIRVIPQPFI